MNLSIFQQTNPVGAGNSLVAAIYKASAPSILIALYQFPGPYTGATQLHTFPGLANVVYNYVLYESPDGGADGTVRNSFSVQPNISSYNVRDPLYLEADTSPFFSSGTNFYGQDSSLLGWNWYLELVASGTQHYSEIWTKTIAGVPTTADDTTADGWKLTTPGALIAPDERWVIHFLPQLAASTSSSGTFINGTQLLTSNTVLDNSAVGQTFLLQGGGGYIGITLPDISTVPDNEPIFFNSNGGSHINAGLICHAGQFLQWYDNQTNLSSNTRNTSLYLGQCESGYIYRFTFPDNSKRWLVFGMDGARLVGETVYDYSRIPLNTIFANGQLLSRVNYARLWTWVQNLESGLLIPDSQYNNTITVYGTVYQQYWGNYTSGDGSTTFRVPTLWKYGFQRTKNGATGLNSYNGLPGSFYAQQIGAHIHPTHGGGAILGSGQNWYLSISNARYSAGGGGDRFGGMLNTPDVNMITGYNNNGNVAAENLPSSTGIYALIRV